MSNFDFICERYEFPHNFFSTYNTSNSDVSSHKFQNVMTWCNDVSSLRVWNFWVIKIPCSIIRPYLPTNWNENEINEKDYIQIMDEKWPTWMINY